MARPSKGSVVVLVGTRKGAFVFRSRAASGTSWRICYRQFFQWRRLLCDLS